MLRDWLPHISVLKKFYRPKELCFSARSDKIAIIFSKLPPGTGFGREALDLDLALSNINQLLVFFIDKGIFNLTKDSLIIDIKITNLLTQQNTILHL